MIWFDLVIIEYMQNLLTLKQLSIFQLAKFYDNIRFQSWYWWDKQNY